jgi:hypothetical protein
VAPAPIVAELPPPPPPPVPDQPPPPPLIVYSWRPPDLGGVRIEDFSLLPPPPPPGVLPPPPVTVVEREEPVRQRLFHISIELGDNLFRRGRFREAHSHFEMALNLCPDRAEVRLRIDSCKPRLPPPPPPPVVVVNVPPPVVVAPSRIAVLNFVVNADPSLVPPAFGDWAAEQMASYFTPSYHVVDRGEVCWYMGRLGLTYRDVLVDASARRWLGRALNVRFFVFGAIQQTASFNVTTHLVDAESGVKQGGGSIHVQDHNELKLRLGELAGQTKTEGAEQAQLKQQAQESERVLNEARRLLKEGQPAKAAEVCRDGLKQQPNHAGIQALLHQAEQQVQQQALAEARKRENERQQALAAEAQRHQQALARQAEAARIRAQRAAAAAGEAERRAQEQQRQKAAQQLAARGQLALQQGNSQQAIQLLQSAAALNKTDANARALAQARAQADETARKKVADEQARRIAEASRQREAELARSRQQVADERRRKEAEDKARHQAQEARDQAAYTKLLDDGRRLMAQDKYPAALTALENARQLRKTDEVDRLIGQIQGKQAQAAAQQKGAEARAELERRQAQEKQARDQAELRARQNRDQYTQALQAAQQAMAAKRYDQAVARYQEAGKLFKTDAVLNGMHQAEEAQRQQIAAQQGLTQQRQEEQKKAAQVKQLVSQGLAALRLRNVEAAARSINAAAQLAPRDPEVLRAQQDLQRAQATMTGDTEAARKRARDFLALLTKGKEATTAQRWDDAVNAFAAAHRLMPEDRTAEGLLAQAETARQEQARKKPMETEADRKKRLADYQKAMTTGKQALAAKRYDDAIKAFTEAGRLQPGDRDAAALLKEADRARKGGR